MTKDKSFEHNQDELNKLALDFVSEFSQLSQDTHKSVKEHILGRLYKELLEVGNLLGFKEPIYWANAYDDFCESEPNYESCIAEINYYLFNIVIGKDKKFEGELAKTYKSIHDLSYQTMMSLFIAVSGHFYSLDISREKQV